MASHVDDYEITGAMISFGGSFAHQLAVLFRLGDEENRRILKTAFPEYWRRYRELALKRHADVAPLGVDPGKAQEP